MLCISYVAILIRELINDPLRFAKSSRRVFLNQESESDSEPYWSLREECETQIEIRMNTYYYFALVKVNKMLIFSVENYDINRLKEYKKQEHLYSIL